MKDRSLERSRERKCDRSAHRHPSPIPETSDFPFMHQLLSSVIASLLLLSLSFHILTSIFAIIDFLLIRTGQELCLGLIFASSSPSHSLQRSILSFHFPFSRMPLPPPPPPPSLPLPTMIATAVVPSPAMSPVPKLTIPPHCFHYPYELLPTPPFRVFILREKYLTTL